MPTLAEFGLAKLQAIVSYTAMHTSTHGVTFQNLYHNIFSMSIPKIL